MLDVAAAGDETFELERCEHADAAVPAGRVVERLDVVENRESEFLAGRPAGLAVTTSLGGSSTPTGGCSEVEKFDEQV